ncbi:MAG: sulfotransferase [Calditrichaeota bacterium]|nr:MAG: sulfotransferase [Calditrichota bacterium]MBL1203789.1 sulfotransferase [Calditrichota bacterium]NOG43619.1 hypothetical protein [Calditrichota bacterium]
MKKSNFFIVGAPKCGTTALVEYLKPHPDVYFPFGQKEINYFGQDLKFGKKRNRKIEEKNYFTFYEKAKCEKRLGDASILNLYSKTAAQEIFNYNPMSKIIIMLRNPVDMMFSHHSQLIFNADEDIIDFEQALEMEKERQSGINIPKNTFIIDYLFYRKLADFAPQVERYLDIFSQENVHIIIFDDFIKETPSEFKKILQFLKIDYSFTTEFSIVNPNKKSRLKSLQNILKHPPKAVLLLKTILPYNIRSIIKQELRKANTKYVKRNPIKDDLRRKLTIEFKPKIKKLEKVISRDLSSWYKEV